MEKQLKTTAMRYPAVPLITHDPYFSLWSFADNLHEDDARHWTGRAKNLRGIIEVDGELARFMGGWWCQDTARQLSCRVLPTRTVYEFEFRGVKLTVTFLTPALLHDLKVLSRPLSYVLFQAEAQDGRPHQCRIFWACGGNLCLNDETAPVNYGRLGHAKCDLMFLRAANQQVLGKCGDVICIDWGSFFLAVPHRQNAQCAIGNDNELFKGIVDRRQLPPNDSTAMTSNAGTENWLSLATAIDLPLDEERYLVCAYDDEYSVEYLNCRLRGYWHTEFGSFGDMLSAAIDQKDELKAECEAFDELLLHQARTIGGEEYADICALAYRQAIAAHKLVADNRGTPLFFSKENYSDGDICTVDVTYPSAPLFLFLSPELVRGMLTPILDYAANRSRWRHPFAPHDLGLFPLANGQAYGGGEKDETNQMPVEECGNILLLCGALLRFHNDVDFLRKYEHQLREWAQYLLEKGYDPENQLCTDDFAGHLAHNANLSLKAILAMGAWAHICQALGCKGEAKHFYETAMQAASRWVHDANDGDHYRLAFDQPGTWSQKYNLVWDRLLDLRLFPAEVAETEMAFYRRHQGQFGLPLDSRKEYTKLDWIIWSACLTGSREDFDALVHPVRQWLENTCDRVPMSDWYETAGKGEHRGFQARSVVGGVFLPFLYHMIADRL